jgi:hypothetical protein
MEISAGAAEFIELRRITLQTTPRLYPFYWTALGVDAE